MGVSFLAGRPRPLFAGGGVAAAGAGFLLAGGRPRPLLVVLVGVTGGVEGAAAAARLLEELAGVVRLDELAGVARLDELAGVARLEDVVACGGFRAGQLKQRNSVKHYSLL